MKKKITTILLTFAIAITGINTPADKVNAETSKARTTQATAEAPAETTAPTPTVAPTPTITPSIGAYRNWGDPEKMEIYTENGWEKVEWKMWDTCGNLTLTPTGWKYSYDNEVIRERNEAKMKEMEAEEAKKPHDIRIGIINESREENTTMLEDGDTAEITKGFDTELSFKATGDASPNWTSSNPEAVAITKTTQNKDKKTAVLTGKNYGTSVVTAEYNGYKISITIKVMKNERRYDEKTRDWGCSGKKKTMEYTADCSAVVSYDKKGNLVVKYTEKNFKWKKSKAKSKIVFKGLCITMSDEKGKTVFNNEVKNFRMTVHPKKKTASVTVKVKRKYLKKKKTQDLRKCSFMTMKRVGKTVKK